MYIPALFSTSANGCPSGTNAYRMANATVTNLNTGARGRITVNANTFTTDVVGENFQGLGTYISDIQLPVITNNSASFDVILPPSSGFDQQPYFGFLGTVQSVNYFLTSSTGQNLNYCYDCTQKFRYTIGSRACQPAPWPLNSTPLKLAVLTNPTGSITNANHYTAVTFDFCAGVTGSIEGYGPIWYDQRGGSLNSSAYYIVSREAI